MDILVIGPWLLLLMSMVLLLVAAYVVVKQLKRGLLPLLVFGVLLGGLAIHGVAFLDPYGSLLEKMIASPSRATYQAAFNKIGSGKVPAPYEEAMLAVALRHPIDDMGTLLDDSIRTSTDPRGMRVLTEAGTALTQQKVTAELATEALREQQLLTEAGIGTLDPPTRWHVADELLRRPNAELETLGLDRGRLEHLRERALPQKPDR